MIGKILTVLDAYSFHTMSQRAVYEFWDADLPKAVENKNKSSKS
jgi:hypothetical protein